MKTLIFPQIALLLVAATAAQAGFRDPIENSGERAESLHRAAGRLQERRGHRKSRNAGGDYVSFEERRRMRKLDCGARCELEKNAESRAERDGGVHARENRRFEIRLQHEHV